ncbi:exodeoxyribonuclease V subunit gamma [Silvimonas sp.]|uniref:exodeoxyribonuclease V subunit gamma n=1 Tax=Silvimonas sp. TaxID=2650811 RepID=UPI0028456CE6|nr:exodeoxyribonuclease V subunit gamma [Silvimonas sp.]MDR3426444.1 exodeoxyribonuclease V subunit gamma [Silvimonas sp.]
MTHPIPPGLLVLHGNRLELLRDAVFQWISQQPLNPLEEAIFLVQSNSIAEWLKMSLAEQTGICAAAAVQLPARFLWQGYRQMLGKQAVPPVSPLDKAPLAWRLMRILPALPLEPSFAPLQRFMQDGDPARRWQLAEKLADLYDQYQVYRADWLADWAAGKDTLRRANGQIDTLTDDQRWQAALWRAILADVPEETRATSRDAIHRQFVSLLEAGVAPAVPLPRRVVLFGVSTLPMQTLEALAALSQQCQVILAVPNPCQFHWGDIMDGRELLRAARRRHPLRDGRDLGLIDLDTMHVHSNPLLASWGRQGRDFVRMLDEFDDAAAARERFNAPRIDLFDDETGQTILAQLQAQVRDLEPLPQPQDRLAVAADDRSIVFHIAHSAQREVEILHDQLLKLFAAATPAQPLSPRDVVVMVPDIETFAPAIRAVFGQYGNRDERTIPWLIADQKNRGINPVLKAMEWLLRLPEQRCRLSEIRDLLDVPALAERFGLAESDLARLAQWSSGAGVRWGLSAGQRAQLDLAACGEQNSWLFGLRRMLLGYASGNDATFAGIEPYAEVGGLDAALAGSLATLVAALLKWSSALTQALTPDQWSDTGRALLADFFAPDNEADRLTLIALESALQRWLEACDTAQFTDAVPLAVLREAWLGNVDEPTLNQRFLAGGVTFCTLMPMRAIPFKVVCLLGMNDGDYPRQANRTDFDLISQPGQYRPGDRSRRDDDRYLMLEAVLAARHTLYISWTGRNARDNSEQPPSVLVSQLRDYLRAGWQDGVIERLTTEHPLQPFSRRYFEGGELLTYAREWRAAHQTVMPRHHQTLAPFDPTPEFRLTLPLLAEFLRNPVKTFFRQRLNVVFDQLDIAQEDEEPFVLNGLEQYQLVQTMLASADTADLGDAPHLAALIDNHAERITRTGRLPIGPMGKRTRDALAAQVTPAWQQWLLQLEAWPAAGEKVRLHFEHAGLQVEDWLDGLRQQGHARAWLQLDPGVLCKDDQPRAEKLILPWVRQLVAAACGEAITGIIVSRDAVLTLGQPEQQDAIDTLEHILAAWQQGMAEPLPFAGKTALAAVSENGKPWQVYEGGMFSPAERDEPCLARTWPDYESLIADGRFATLATALFAPLQQWITEQVGAVTHDASATDEETADE